MTRLAQVIGGLLRILLVVMPALSCRTATGGQAGEGTIGMHHTSRSVRTPPDSTYMLSAGVTFGFTSVPDDRYTPLDFAVRLGRGDSVRYVPGAVLKQLAQTGGWTLLPNDGIYPVRPGAPLPVRVAFLDTLYLAYFEYAPTGVSFVLPPAPPHALWTITILVEPKRNEEELRKDWYINRVLTRAARMPSGDSMFVDVFAGKPEYHIIIYH